MDYINQFITQTWLMIAEMGPYLLLGLAIAAILHRLLRQEWVERLMGKRSLSSVVWGSVVGVPMPLCSCGVIPVTMSLRSKGASNGASVSFLTSTPQTGVDSILATWGMLGPVFAIYKVIVAFISGILIGLVVDLLPQKPNAAKRHLIGEADLTKNSSTSQPTWSESVRYGFVTMPGDLSGALLFGFLLAGLIAAFAPADLLANIPGGTIAAIALATLISVPFYICSTGSIPLAIALVHSGLPISAALVLLIAGPATNIATITAMRKILGGRATFLYVLGIVLTTWIAAAIYHLFLNTGTLGTEHMDHVMELPWWKHLGGALLLALLILPKFGLFQHQHDHDSNTDQTMQTTTLKIAGMNCSHCENSVRNGLASLPNAPTVLSVDRNAETAVIQADTFDESAVREKIEALGFTYQGTA